MKLWYALWLSILAGIAGAVKHVSANDRFLSRKASQEQQSTSDALSQELNSLSAKQSRLIDMLHNTERLFAKANKSIVDATSSATVEGMRLASTSLDVGRQIVQQMLQVQDASGDVPAAIDSSLDALEDDVEDAEEDAPGSDPGLGGTDNEIAPVEQEEVLDDHDMIEEQLFDDEDLLDEDEMLDDEEDDMFIPETVTTANGTIIINPERIKLSERLVRPEALTKDKATIINFGIFTKDFHGVNYVHELFQVNCIITASWRDPRVVDVIPDGLTYITMESKDARRLIWMPKIAITNRGNVDVERLSSSVTLDAEGTVTQVVRRMVRCKTNFMLNDFPFDKQHLQVKIASSRYVVQDVKLKPLADEKITGVREHIFDDKGFVLQDYTLFEYEEKEGVWNRSYGVLDMLVKHEPLYYTENHIIPTVIYLMISWAVFWIPFGPPQFSTPRLALSILAIFVFTKRVIATNAQLPLDGPPNWNDLFNFHAGTLFCITITFNIVSEFVQHQLKLDQTAKVINHVMKVCFPFIAVPVLSLILFNAAFDWGLSQTVTDVLADLILVCAFLLISFYWFGKLWKPLLAYEKREIRDAWKASIDGLRGVGQ